MASIEEANLLFKNLVTYEKSVVMAKKYVKYHKAVVEDLKRLEKLEKAIDILKDKMNLAVYHNKVYNTYSIDLLKFKEDFEDKLSQEEYELLKEVFGNE